VTDRPRSSEEEVSFILGTMGEYLGIRVGRSDVLSAWSGIRPLPSNPKAQAKDTQSIVRDHGESGTSGGAGWAGAEDEVQAGGPELWSLQI
jgi:glycerol-3-phosphate dehydrogenase